MTDSYDGPAGDKIQVKLSNGTTVSLNDFLNREGLTGDDQQLQEALQMYATSTVGNKQLQEIANNYDTLFKGEGELCITAGSLDNLYGEYNKANNTLTIDVSKCRQPYEEKCSLEIAKTVAHELTHAQDDNMLENAGNEPGTPAFVRANLITEMRAKLNEVKIEAELAPTGPLSAFAKQYNADQQELGETEADKRFISYLSQMPIKDLPSDMQEGVSNWRKIYSKQAGLKETDAPFADKLTDEADSQNFVIKILMAIISLIQSLFTGAKVSKTLQNTQKREGNPSPTPPRGKNTR